MGTQSDATRERAGPDGRALLTAGLVLLGATAGLAMGRVFLGTAPGIRLALVGAVAAGLAVALERRPLAVSLGASAAGLALAAAYLLFPETTRWGLPTGRTLSAVASAAARVGRDALAEIAPAPPLPSLVLAALAGVWAAASAGHALAVRAASPMLALLPPAAVIGFAGAIAEDGPRRSHVALFLAGGLAVLFGTGLARLGLWGPVVPWHRHARWRATRGPTGQGARRLGLAAVAAALLLPGLLPGFRAGALVDVTPAVGPGRAVNPIVDIGASLQQDPAIEYFRVRSPQPAYWRLVSLERFDGRVWDTDDLEALSGELVETAAVLPAPVRASAVGLRQEVQVVGPLSPWMPAAFLPRRVFLDGAARYDPERGSLVRVGGQEPGQRYVVLSQVAAPSPAELDRAIPPSRATLPPVYTSLPPDLPLRFHDIARDLARGETVAYRRILAIQDHLRGFTYDETIPPSAGGEDMLFFLEESRRGFCVQFAGTMAALVRSLGYPARVALGFTPGQQDDDGWWRVTSKEAHTWVEVYFPQYGWLAFEPTPTRMNPVARSYVQPAGLVPGGGGASGDITRVGAREGTRQQADPGTAADPPAALAPPGRSGVSATPWPRAAAGVAVVALLGLAMVPTAKAVARRWWLARARGPRALVLASYRLFQSRASDLGMRRRSGETLWEYRARLRQEVAFSDGHLERLTALAGRALYSERDLTIEEAREAEEAGRLAARDVRRQVGRARAALGTVRLPRRP